MGNVVVMEDAAPQGETEEVEEEALSDGEEREMEGKDNPPEGKSEEVVDETSPEVEGNEVDGEESTTDGKTEAVGGKTMETEAEADVGCYMIVWDDCCLHCGVTMFDMLVKSLIMS